MSSSCRRIDGENSSTSNRLLYSICRWSGKRSNNKTSLTANNKLKLEIYNYDDIPSEYPKFILGFGGIKQSELENHVNALIETLIK